MLKFSLWPFQMRSSHEPSIPTSVLVGQKPYSTVNSSLPKYWLGRQQKLHKKFEFNQPIGFC